MPATTNKQRLLTNLMGRPEKAEAQHGNELPVLEQFIYGICREGVTRRQADQAFKVLRERFFGMKFA
jgi:hypothetical protein